MGYDIIAYLPADQGLLQELFEKHRQQHQLVAAEYYDRHLSSQLPADRDGDILRKSDVHYAHALQMRDHEEEDPPEHSIYTTIQTKWLNAYDWSYPCHNPNYVVDDSGSAMSAADDVEAAFPDDPHIRWFAEWLRVTASLGQTKYVMSC